MTKKLKNTELGSHVHLAKVIGDQNIYCIFTNSQASRTTYRNNVHAAIQGGTNTNCIKYT